MKPIRHTRTTKGAASSLLFTSSVAALLLAPQGAHAAINTFYKGSALQTGGNWTVTSSGTNPTDPIAGTYASAGPTGTSSVGSYADLLLSSSVNSLASAGSTAQKLIGQSLNVISGSSVSIQASGTGNTDVQLGATATWSGTTPTAVTSDITFTNAVSGGSMDAIYLSNSSSLTFSNVNATASPGVLSISLRSGSSTAVNFNVGTGSTLAINVPIGGMSSGGTTASGVTIKGSGLTIFGGTNTYTGTTTVSSGTLQYGVANAISTGAVTVSGGTLDLQSYSDSVGAVTLSSGAIIGTGTLTTTGNFSLTNSGSISAVLDGASQTLAKSGTGTLYLNAANTYSGAVTISGGVLSTNSIAAAGSASGIGKANSSNANLVIDGGTLQYTGTGASTNRRFTVGTGGATLDANTSGFLSFSNSGAMATTGTGARTLTLTGISTSGTLSASLIDDATGATSLVKSGSGNWVLDTASTYTGNTTINSGILGVKNATALGSGTIIFNGGGLSVGSSTGYTLGNKVQANADINLGGIGSNGVTLSGAVDLGGAMRAVTLAANSHEFSGKISNGGITLNSSSSSRKLTLSGSNDYAGGTTVTGGILLLGNANALGTGGLTLNGGSVDLNSNSISIPSLSGTSGSVTASGSVAAVLTLNQSSDTAFSGSITNGTNGNILSVVKNGSGMITLSSNSFSGGITLNSGSIGIKSSSALGTGALTVNGGAIGSVTSSRTLTNNVVVGGDFVAGVGDNSLTLNGNVDLGGTTRTVSLMNTLTLGGVVSNGGLNVTLASGTTRTLNLAGVNTYTGDTTLQKGLVVLSGSIAGSATRVYNDSVFRGTGKAGSVSLYDTATLAAGADAATLGTLSTGALSLSGSSILALKLNTATLASDKIDVTGNFSLDSGNSVVLSLSDLGADQVLTAGSVFTLLSYSGSWNGNTFNGLADDSTLQLGSNLFALSYNGVTGTDNAVTLQVVPEPGAWSLITGGMGLLAFGTRLRRRQK